MSVTGVLIGKLPRQGFQVPRQEPVGIVSPLLQVLAAGGHLCLGQPLPQADLQQGQPIFDRFRPVAEVPIRSLPAGIKVAGPDYAAYADDTENTDDQWLVMTELTRPGEALGQLVGVMYAPDGTTLLTNPANDSDFFWIDLNDSGIPEMELSGDDVVNPTDPADRVFATQPVNVFLFLQLFQNFLLPFYALGGFPSKEKS